MAKTVDDAFNIFAGWLKATTTETEKAASHRRSIQGRLTTDFDLKNMFRSGSFGHDTGVSGYSDIDYFAVIPAEKLKRNSGSTLRAIKDSLQLRFPYTEISVRSPAVIIPFGNSPSEKHEIVPADYVELSNGHRVYDIPDRHDGWMRSSPAAHNKWVTDEHQRLNNKLKPLICMIKAWNYYKSGGIRSFYLELRTTEYVLGEKYISYKFDVARVLRHLYKRSWLRCRIRKVYRDIFIHVRQQLSQQRFLKLKQLSSVQRKHWSAKIKGIYLMHFIGGI